MKPAVSRRPPWRILVPLAVTVMIAFGVMLYGFSIYVTRDAAGAVFSKTVLSIAYGGAVVTGGLLAVPVGRYADRNGVRRVLLAGGVLGFAGFGVFATATAPLQVVAAWWLLLGPAGAMTYYEIAYVAVDQWCTVDQRATALGTLTLIGGFAGIVFIPLVQVAVDRIGWRSTALASGASLLAAALTSGFALRRAPLRHPEAGARVTAPARTRALLREGRFVIHTAALALTFFAAQAIIAHRVARFEEAGFPIGTVAVWAAAASALSLPGRCIGPILAARINPAGIQAAATVLLTAGALLMIRGTSPWEMVGHFVLFGAAFGAVLPLRAMTMATWYSGPGYGAKMGAQWMVTTLFGAFGPAAVGLLRDTTGTYRPAMMAVTAALLVSAGLLWVTATDRFQGTIP